MFGCDSRIAIRGRNNIKPSFADVVKNLEKEASNIKQNLQQLKTVVKDRPKLETNDIEPTINEMQDRERRAYNVLVFGVDKDTNNNERDRTSSDMTTIKNILTKVSTGTDTEKIRILRLGKYEPSKKSHIPYKGTGTNCIKKKRMKSHSQEECTSKATKRQHKRLI